MRLVIVAGVSAVRLVILPSEGCKGTDTHKFFERYIQPKVDLQEMRKLVSDHSKKQARERGGNTYDLLQGNSKRLS